jgi:hypothetical protein
MELLSRIQCTVWLYIVLLIHPKIDTQHNIFHCYCRTFAFVYMHRTCESSYLKPCPAVTFAQIGGRSSFWRAHICATARLYVWLLTIGARTACRPIILGSDITYRFTLPKLTETKSIAQRSIIYYIYSQQYCLFSWGSNIVGVFCTGK